jgi:predicted dithiol-disulfide oxidoreductase (DUF899 family)
MLTHPVVSREEWTEARKRHLVREKQLTRLRDELSAERRTLPWVEVTKRYEFDGPDGRETLSGLFGSHSQLIVRHFMFGPGWGEGCVSCSFLADHIDGANLHLGQRDVTLVCVSRAKLGEIQAFKQRMGWRFKWVSSYGGDFNHDFNVSFTPEEAEAGRVYYNYEMQAFQCDEMPGISVFYKDDNGRVFHTYSSFGRGNELLLGTYHFLDVVPKGRDETGPRGNMTDWVRHHDRYDSGGQYTTAAGSEDDCCR